MTIDGAEPSCEDATAVVLGVYTLTHRLTSRFGNSGTRGSSAIRSSGTSRRWISACFVAERISLRSDVARVASTVTSTFVTALARVSLAVRWLTGTPNVTVRSEEHTSEL